MICRIFGKYWENLGSPCCRAWPYPPSSPLRSAESIADAILLRAGLAVALAALWAGPWQGRGKTFATSFS